MTSIIIGNSVFCYAVSIDEFISSCVNQAPNHEAAKQDILNSLGSTFYHAMGGTEYSGYFNDPNASLKAAARFDGQGGIYYPGDPGYHTVGNLLTKAEADRIYPNDPPVNTARTSGITTSNVTSTPSTVITAEKAAQIRAAQQQALSANPTADPATVYLQVLQAHGYTLDAAGNIIPIAR